MFSYISSFFHGDIGATVTHLTSANPGESDNAVQQLLKYEDDKSKTEIIEKGAIPHLVALLANPETKEVTKEHIANLLANLALSSKESKIEITEKGGIPPLVALLAHGNPAQTQKNAIIALMNILVEDENVTKCDENVVQACVELLEHADDEIKRHAAGTLANMATDKEKRQQMVQRNSVPALVELLKSANIFTKGQAAGALMNIVEGDDMVKLQIANLGAVPNLVSLLQNGATAGKVRAISLLYDLLGLSVEDVKDEIKQPEVIELVQDVVTNGSSMESQSAEPLLLLLKSLTAPSLSSSPSSSSPSAPLPKVFNPFPSPASSPAPISPHHHSISPRTSISLPDELPNTSVPPAISPRFPPTASPRFPHASANPFLSPATSPHILVPPASANPFLSPATSPRVFHPSVAGEEEKEQEEEPADSPISLDDSTSD